MTEIRDERLLPTGSEREPNVWRSVSPARDGQVDWDDLERSGAPDQLRVSDQLRVVGSPASASGRPVLPSSHPSAGENDADEPGTQVVRSRRRRGPSVHASRMVNLLLLDAVLVMAVVIFVLARPIAAADRLPVIGQLGLWWLLMLVLGGYDASQRRGTRRSVTLTALALCATVQLIIDAVTQQAVRLDVLLALGFLTLGSLIGRTLIGLLRQDRVLVVSTSGGHAGAVDTLIIEPDDPADVTIARVLERASLTAASVVEIQPDCRLAATSVQRLAWELRMARVSLRFPLATGPTDARRVAQISDRRGVLLEVQPPRASIGARLCKRLLDISVSGGLLLLLSPVLLVLAAVVKLTSKGPVLYLQERIGRDGLPFKMIKFRSMIADADAQLLQLLQAQGKGAVPLFKVDNDPRLTRVGAVMRRYSLDELPQLINVLTGSMSLVGPRPQRSYEVDLYDELATHRLGVLPGMTGLWQVSGRSRLSWAEAIALDVEYVHNWSLRHDVSILARTAKAVLGADGAV